MKTLTAQKVSYEICEFLGEGLTSQVYKAFRRDRKGYTRQEVALKILKSKKHVQVLKTEFEKLIQVDSKYCVKVLAWESLPTGAALVLEYIEGVSLEQIHRIEPLSQELVEEVRIQVTRGLQCLHREKIVHGDLNLKNILVTKQGVIKLIDFGFFDSENQSYFTPEFAEPALLQGAAPNPKSDFYSLEKIIDDLTQHRVSRAADKALAQPSKKNATISRGWRRRALAQKVCELRLQSHNKTQIIASPIQKNKMNSVKRFATVILASFVFLILLLEETSGTVGFFQVKGHSQWLQFSMNNGAPRFGPIAPKLLRAGQYSVTLRTPKGQEQRAIRISKNETFVLQP